MASFGFVTFLLFFHTPSAVAEGLSSLNQAAAFQISCERSLNYLERYHEDFKTLRIEFALHDSDNADIRIHDAHDNLLIRFPVTTGTFNRRIFHQLANLLLSTETPLVSQSALDSLRVSWYWDALAMENPAVFDQLNALEEGDVPATEQTAFWRYRLLMQQNGGRDELWKRIKSDPTLIERLNTTQSLSVLDTLELLELKHYRLSPVQKHCESEMLLRSLQTFRLVHPDSDKKQWVSIEKLPPKLLEDSNSDFIQEVTNRLLLIKSSLPSTNPLFLNAFQSLGVCFERLLDQDATGYQAALKRFLQDFEFAQQVQDEIRARQAKQQSREN